MHLIFLLLYYATYVFAEGPKVRYELVEAIFPEWADFWYRMKSSWPDEIQKDISNIQSSRQSRLKNSTSCMSPPNCTIDALLLTDGDEQALRRALQISGANQSLLNAWPRYVNATNRILKVYGAGYTPEYAVDVMSYNPKSTDWKEYINSKVNWTYKNPQDPPLDAIGFAVDLLDANDRNDVLRFRKLWCEENKPALDRARRLDWSKYRFSAVVILGGGPDTYDDPLSPLGKLRIEMALSEYNKGISPFLIPTGGDVHPTHTNENEAGNMRRWLLEQYGVHEDEIVMEPYARHTTTNLRNSARILFEQLGAPMNKSILVVTDPRHMSYVRSPSFVKRCESDLGYSIGEIRSTWGDWGVEFFASPSNSFVDPMDPLDP